MQALSWGQSKKETSVCVIAKEPATNWGENVNPHLELSAKFTYNHIPRIRHYYLLDFLAEFVFYTSLYYVNTHGILGPRIQQFIDFP